jgi:hypothetical protein
MRPTVPAGPSRSKTERRVESRVLEAKSMLKLNNHHCATAPRFDQGYPSEGLGERQI